MRAHWRSAFVFAALAAGCANNPAPSQQGFVPSDSGGTGQPTNPPAGDTGGGDPAGSVAPSGSTGSSLEDAGGGEVDEVDEVDAGDAGIDYADEIAPDAARSFHCDYDNLFADQSGNVPGCKDYPEAMSEADAAADCMAHKPAAGSGVLSAGACALEGANGYCSDHAGTRDVGYEGGCDSETTGSGAWACKTFIDKGTGTWTCLLTEPDYRCVWGEPAEGAPSCRSYRSGTTMSDAELDCDGTLEEGACETSGAAATCTSKGGDIDVFTEGYCTAYEQACADAEGSFNCVTSPPAETVHSCHVTDRDCTLLVFCSTKTYCVDYPESAGFTAQSASAACDAEAENDKGDARAFSSDTGEGCAFDEPVPATRCVQGDGSRRYGEDKCDGTSELVDTCKPELSGIITCRYHDDNANGPACIDYATKDGWTSDSALAHCESQKGSDYMLSAESCLSKEGATGGSRCQTKNGTDKTWYAYGTPSFVCSNFLGGTAADGPFCSGY